jgi:hypothetical protein
MYTNTDFSEKSNILIKCRNVEIDDIVALTKRIKEKAKKEALFSMKILLAIIVVLFIMSIIIYESNFIMSIMFFFLHIVFLLLLFVITNTFCQLTKK